MNGTHYTYNKSIKFYLVGLVFFLSILPVSMLFQSMDEPFYYGGTFFIIIGAYVIGLRSLKQITITHDEIEIIYIFGKKSIAISDIKKTWEGTYAKNIFVSPRSIVFELKDGSKYLISSRDLDEKTKTILLAISIDSTLLPEKTGN